MLNISNIKISVKTKANPHKLKVLKTNINPKKENGSFFVHRYCGFVFSVYYSGHINVTGLKSFEKIPEVQKIIKSFYGIKKIISTSVDNITCSATINPTIYKWNRPFTSFLRDIEKEHVFDIIQYSPQTFPGAFLKTKNCGTIVFFATGKFNVVGCKTIKSIKKLLGDFFRSVIRVKNCTQNVL